MQQLAETRAGQKLTVRSIRKKQDLQLWVIKTFPEMTQSDWGVREVYNEENDVALEYLLLPLWFSETFIIDHQNSLSYRQQRNKLLSIDSLHQEIGMLEDNLFVLERERANAFKTGYNQAYGQYENLTKNIYRYFKNPLKFREGCPHGGWWPWHYPYILIKYM